MEKIRYWQASHARLFAAIELGVVSVSILLQIWVFQRKNLWGAYFAIVLIVGGWIVRKENLESLGLIGKWFVLPVMVLFIGKTLLGRLPFFHINGAGLKSMLLRVSMYFAWALVQQLILNSFFVKRLQALAKETRIPGWAGVIFGMSHAPNLVLMPVTMLGGVASGYAFLHMEKKNLYLIAAVHAIIGMIIFYYVPQAWHHNMVVGPKWWSR